ncbi:MAG TPA: GNAT family N-acetyltransferase [Verrucomicrobiae bacterium]|nr:GNAT family N-acetyltransferase [Verrucomicrobiae bacterium]
MSKPELEHGDYVRYERGTAPLPYRAPRDRADHPTRKRKQTPTERSPQRFPERNLSPIEIKLADEEKKAEPERNKVRKEMPFTLAFRPIEGEDFNFILNAWMMSYRDSKRDHNNQSYFQGQQNLIAEISKRRNLIVGCDAETPNWIAGFICGIMLQDGRLLLDYIYVKHAYRERGIARGLLSAMGWTQDTEIIATHWTRQIDKVGRRYNAGHNSYFNQIGFSDV